MISYSDGPWKEHIDDDGKVWVTMPDGHSVYIGDMEGTCGTCHANAQLIIASPELYKVAKQVEHIGQLADDPTCPDAFLIAETQVLRNMAKAALNLAIDL